jgi:PAS domain S-box-containing protein
MSTQPNGTSRRRDAQQQYQQLVASIDGIVWEADARTFQFTFVSQQAERLLGYPLDEWFTPGFWAEHIHPEDRAWAVEFCLRATREKRKHDFEYRMLAADGRTVWLRDIVSVAAEGGEATTLRGIMVDVTERKRTEQALVESEELYRLLTEGANDLIYLLDLEGRILYASPSVGRLLGRVPRHKFEVVHPDDVAAGQACWQRILAGKSELLTVRVADAGGAWRWLEAWSSLIRYHDQPRVLSVCRDVSERKEAEDRFRRTAEELQRVMSSVSDYLWSGEIDEQGRWSYHYYSPVVERITGRPPSYYLQGPERWLESIHAGDRERLQAAFQRVVSGQSEREEAEYRVVRPDGEIRWVRDCATVTRLGRRLRIDGVVSDVTERKRAEEERQAHLWFLESMDRVNRAIQGTSDLEQMMRDVLGVVLSIFGCDRAWLVYPCDPEAASWRVPMERTRPEYPGAFALEVAPSLTPEEAPFHQAVRAAHGPLRFGPGMEHPLVPQVAERFHIRSMLVMAIYPKLDKPYMFGLHQCSHVRVWTPQESRLFQEIGRRLADALSSLLLFRNLRESERKLGLAQGIAHVGYWDRDVETGRVIWSEETCRIFGRPTEERELDVARVLEQLHPEDRGRVAQAIAAALQGGPRYEVEYRVVLPGGEARFIHSQGDVTRDESGRPRRMFGTVQDVTERKRAEDALRRSEAYLAEAQRLGRTGSWAWDVATREFVHWSHEHYRLHGLDPQGGTPTWEAMQQFIHPEDRARCLEQIERAVRERTDCEMEYRAVLTDGTTKYIHSIAHPVFNAAGELVEFVGTEMDVTERKRAEQALVESHGLLNAVVEGTADAVFVKDLRGRYLMINSAGARFVGRPVAEILGKDDRELFSPETACRLMECDLQVMATGGAQMFEETATPAAGVTRTYLSNKSALRDADGKVVGLIGIARDVTELKRLEEQLRQSQKMEAIGRLAGGVAHDFNNLLTVINGYSELVFSSLGADDPNHELVAEVQKAGERAANLTRQLLAFSRRQVLQPEVLSLNTLLEDLLKLLKRLIGEDVELSLVPGAGLGLAKVDRGQFEQAVINLAVNARDAMPLGGRLTIETQNAEVDEATAQTHADVRPGRYVLMTVRDTGHGMDEATRARVFEPFFTTKEVGKGTGLGLAMVYGFVKQSGGHVEVESEVGRGTTFKVYLPRAEATGPLAKSSPNVLEAPRGSETVLLVEDEDSVRTLSRLVLQSSGYTVLEARDGQEGAVVAQQHPGPIHVLVTDLVMPRMSGRQLADVVSQARPGVRVLFLSGYTDEAMAQRGAIEAGLAFLQKPFSPISLVRKVREVLDAEGGPR